MNDKLVWIELEGLPLVAWSNKVVTKIACQCSKVLFVDEDLKASISVG